MSYTMKKNILNVHSHEQSVNNVEIELLKEWFLKIGLVQEYENDFYFKYNDKDLYYNQCNFLFTQDKYLTIKISNTDHKIENTLLFHYYIDGFESAKSVIERLSSLSFLLPEIVIISESDIIE